MNVTKQELDAWLTEQGVDAENVGWPMGLLPASDGSVYMHIRQVKTDDEGHAVTFADSGMALLEDRFLALPVTFMGDPDAWSAAVEYEEQGDEHL